jgi:hypothetical protein
MKKCFSDKNKNIHIKLEVILQCSYMKRTFFFLNLKGLIDSPVVERMNWIVNAKVAIRIKASIYLNEVHQSWDVTIINIKLYKNFILYCN